MKAAPLSAALRRLVRVRAELRCEYCMLAEDDAFLPHEPDHVVAVKHGGVTESPNLALACFDCNRHKGSDLASLDPETGLLSPSQKLERVGALTRAVQELALMDTRRRHPGAAPREHALRVAFCWIGPELMIRAFGWDVREVGS